MVRVGRSPVLGHSPRPRNDTSRPRVESTFETELARAPSLRGGPVQRLPNLELGDHPLRHFDVRAEFPNPFVPKGLRAEDVSDSQWREIEAGVNACLASLFQSTTLAIVQPRVGRAELVPIFSHLQAQLAERHPQARLLAAGGLIRAALGWVTEQLIVRAGSEQTVSERLAEIAELAQTTPFAEVFGVASDIDLQIDGGDAEVDTAARQLSATLSSVRTTYGLGQFGNFATRAFYPVPDVKERTAQLTRAVAQGGSPIDWLAFDMVTQTLVSPLGHEDTLRQVLMGRLPVVAPTTGGELSLETLVRLPRALLEIPYLSLSPEDEAQVKSTIAERISSGRLREAEGGVEAQLGKMTRNSRFGGAANRFWRGAPDSLEASFASLIAQLDPSARAFGKFVDRRALAGSSLDADLLMPIAEFQQHHTANGQGLLFHGTKHLDQVLPIFRNGLLTSEVKDEAKRELSHAVYGDGAYVTKDMEVAHTASAGSGAVLELDVKTDPRLAILNLEAHADDPRIARLREEAAAAGMGFHEYLSRVHHVDIVLNTYPIVLNSEAIAFRNPVQSLAEGFASSIRDAGRSFKERTEAMQSYVSLHQYLTAAGIAEVASPITYIAELTGHYSRALSHRVDLSRHGRGEVQLAQLGAGIELAAYLKTLPADAAMQRDLHGFIASLQGSAQRVLASLTSDLLLPLDSDVVRLETSSRAVVRAVKAMAHLNALAPTPVMSTALSEAVDALFVRAEAIAGSPKHDRSFLSEHIVESLLTNRALFVLPEVREQLSRRLPVLTHENRASYGLIKNVFAAAEWGDLPEASALMAKAMATGHVTLWYQPLLGNQSWVRNPDSMQWLSSLATQVDANPDWRSIVEGRFDYSSWPEDERLQTVTQRTGRVPFDSIPRSLN